MASGIKTAILLAGLTALFLGAGWLLGGTGGMAIAFVVAVGINAASFWNSDKMVLSMHGAKEVGREQAGDFYELIEALAENAGLPMPRVFVIQTDQPNAFATGRNPQNAAIAATTGLLRTLSREELAGVMAHELAHVKSRDTLLMTVTATLAGALSMLANFAIFFGGNRDSPLGFVGVLATMILAPLGAMLVQSAISRTREYAADREGAAICQRPEWLADALERIQAGATQIDNNSAERNPATAHLFIINPLHAHAIDGLFSTHPATENRVAALRELAREQGGRPGVGGSPTPPGRAGPWAKQSAGARQSRGAPTGGQRRARRRG